MIIKYKIVQKDGFEIPLDDDEIEGVRISLNKGGFIKTRAGIFNSAYVARLVEDEDRTFEANRRKDENGNLLNEKLDDIFDNKKSKQILLDVVKSDEVEIDKTEYTPEEVEKAVLEAREKRENDRMAKEMEKELERENKRKINS